MPGPSATHKSREEAKAEARDLVKQAKNADFIKKEKARDAKEAAAAARAAKEAAKEAAKKGGRRTRRHRRSRGTRRR